MKLLQKLVLIALAVPAFAPMLHASALNTNTRTVIPKEVQQIISVDYRKLKDSPNAMTLKQRVLPDQLKQFETALRGAGIDPDRDIEQLTFAAYRSGEQGGLRVLGVATGTFGINKIRLQLNKMKVKPTRIRTNLVYPMSGGFQMTFLDNFTMLFGESGVVKTALDVRDGEQQGVNNNSRVTDLIERVQDDGPVWSVLDQTGTQYMMRSALGDAAKLGDYEVVKKRLLGASYTMDLSKGIDFNMTVLTADSMSAGLLSSVVKAGVLYRKMAGSDVEKQTLEGVRVESSSSNLVLQFKADERKFENLLQSELFTAVSR